MVFSVSDWHRRFSRQAVWTASLREYIFQTIKFTPGQRLLDVGCGTGVLIPELKRISGERVYGIDLSFVNLLFAQRTNEGSNLVMGDGLELPFSNSTFDVSLCHFLLLWVKSPRQCLREMCRVTRRGGWVLALAEPDYGGRIDHPAGLGIIGQWQRRALTAQGAEVYMGRKLLALFTQTGFANSTSGVIGGQWRAAPDLDEWQNEWETIEQDLEGLRKKPERELIEQIRAKDLKAVQEGRRILYVPTFYAVGQVP